MEKNEIIEQAVRELGLRVQKERKDQGLTQTQLANLSGVSLNFISQLEGSKNTVQLNKVLAVLNVLGIEFTGGNSFKIKFD